MNDNAKNDNAKHMRDGAAVHGVYGKPPAELAQPPLGAVQFSPLMPGSADLETAADGALESMTMLAPPGAVERRYTIAQSLRALSPGGSLTVLAPNKRGGSRLGQELEGFGCAVDETAKRHHRIVTCSRPRVVADLDAALAEGAMQRVDNVGWSQPGVFSWDRVDAGTALLLEHLPALGGRGADLGCGVGLLARHVLASAKVEHIALIDIDRRAIKAARLNVTDRRADFIWADVRTYSAPANLDFVVMNAPFHDAGAEDRQLALAFVKRAAALLREGGTCWLVANRHLPYEAVLQPLFRQIDLKVEAGGYKIYEARK